MYKSVIKTTHCLHRAELSGYIKDRERFSISIDCRNGPFAASGDNWYKIHHAGEQATHWDIQNKENANLS